MECVVDEFFHNSSRTIEIGGNHRKCMVTMGAGNTWDMLVYCFMNTAMLQV